MSRRVWPHLIIAVIATIFVGLGVLLQGDPYLRGTGASYDPDRQCWDVTGEVVYPSMGTLNYPGGQAKVMERVVPFALKIPDSSGKLSFEGNALPLAIAETQGKSGHRNLNVLALEGGWVVCYGSLWLGWWLIRRRKRNLR